MYFIHTGADERTPAMRLGFADRALDHADVLWPGEKIPAPRKVRRKAATLEVNRGYLSRQILPHFAGRQIADIDRRDVASWFASLRATPAAADRSMPVLSVIMREAEAMGLRLEGSNPCKGIRRHRRKGRERFLSDDELRRLTATLAAYEDRWPLQAAAIRLLLLTGCRKSEILTLHWSDYRDGHLFLATARRVPARFRCRRRRCGCWPNCLGYRAVPR